MNAARHARRGRGVPALALVLLAACGGGEEGAPEPVPDGPPVLVLAIDGLEWNVALPLLRAGRMPNLAGLMERGVAGTLDTLDPTLSPRLWTTVATGQPPEVHGILDFLDAPEERGHPERIRHYTSRDRRVKAYWDVLTDYGVASDTIGWWMTFPVDEVRGLMVAQTNTREVKKGVKKGALQRDVPGQVWPVSEEERVFAVLDEVDRGLDAHLRDVFGELPPLSAEDAQRWEQCSWSFRADRTYLEIAEQRARGGPASRVTAVYVGGTDVVGHRFWSAHEPEPFGLAPDDPEVVAFGGVIDAYYAYTDRAIGELLALLPPDTTVFVLADHGMSGRAWLERTRANPADVPRNTGGHTHQEAGAFVAAGPGVRAVGLAVPLAELRREHLPSLGGLADFCPTLLAVLGVPYGENMAGRPLATVLDPAWLDVHPLRSVPTHDDPAWLARRGEAPAFLEDERVEQLENLGYLGGDE